MGRVLKSIFTLGPQAGDSCLSFHWEFIQFFFGGGELCPIQKEEKNINQLTRTDTKGKASPGV